MGIVAFACAIAAANAVTCWNYIEPASATTVDCTDAVKKCKSTTAIGITTYSCGTNAEANGCQETGIALAKVKTCVCEGEKCNEPGKSSASSMIGSFSAIFFSVLMALF